MFVKEVLNAKGKKEIERGSWPFLWVEEAIGEFWAAEWYNLIDILVGSL